MKKIIVLFVIIIAAASLASASGSQDTSSILFENIKKNIHKLPNKRLTVADFTDINGNETEEGKLLAEQIITKLTQIDELIVIERKQLNKILKEQQLSLTGITEEEEYKLGKILNVDAIVSGTITHLDDSVEIYARMIDVKSGRIYCAANHRINSKQRKMEIARLPAKQQEKVTREFEKREKQRMKNPELHKLIQAHKKQMSQIRKRDQRKFDTMVRTIKQLNKIRKDNPRLFMLLTEPPGSPLLNRVKHAHPGDYNHAVKFRKNIDYVIKNTPLFADVMKFQRKMIMKKGKRRG